MQIHKKEFKPYLYRGLLLAYIGYCCGNFWMVLPGYDLYSKAHNLMTKDLNGIILDNSVQVFLLPSVVGLYLGVLAFLVSLIFYTIDNDKGVYRNGEEHGSARFAKVEEIEKFSDEKPENNIILTRNSRMGLDNKRIPYEHQKNKNAVVFGGPGSGKTFTFIKPNIMQLNSSFLVIDPKGLLIREIGQLLEDAGFKMKIFDLNNLLNSDMFNVFRYIKTELDIDRVLEAITEGTKKKENNSGDDFWRQAEGLLIRAFIGFLWYDGQDNNYLPHLGMIGDMLRLTERKDKDTPSPVEEWFEELNRKHPDNYAYKQWTLFNDLYNGETRMSVLAIAAGRYSIFDHTQVVDMIRYDTMDIESWIDEKTAVFVTIPETNDAYNFLASIFISTAMETLRKTKDDILTGLVEFRETHHFRFYLDEIANVGRIPNVDKALATFRSRDLSLVLVLQALDQLKTMYPKGWATLINTCDTLLFLGGDEKETTEYLSKRAGKQTISVRKNSHNKGRNGGGSESRDTIGRDLLTPDEIGRINGNEALLYISGQFVFKDEKYVVSDHEYADLLANNPGDERWYHYKRYKNDVEKLLDQVKKENMVNHGVISDDIAM